MLEIQGEEIIAFTDTGSKVSLISETRFNQLKDVKIKSCDIRITSITHNVIPVTGEVLLRVECKRSLFHNFIIVPDVYMTVPVLMGADLIGRREIFLGCR